ncbi:MAG: Hpt domain-containing protein [Mycobacteriales bacterium]
MPARALPADVVASLRAAFAEELVERLPRLRRAACEAKEPNERRDPDLRTLAVRDAHTLGSSAYVVGEPEAAHLARRAEALLTDDADADELGAAVDALDAALKRWRP